MRRTAILFVVLAILGLSVGIALAGYSIKVYCSDPKCGFKDRIGFGGGYYFHKMTGYCAKCEKFVTLSWDTELAITDGIKTNEDKEEKPLPIGRIWIPSIGKMRNLYACPHCSGPFLPIGPDDLTHCPKCGNETLKEDPKSKIYYD